MSDDLRSAPAVSAAELNRRFGEVRRSVNDGVVAITHHGQPTMALMSIDHYQRLASAEQSPNLAADWQRKLHLVLDHIREGYLSIDSDFRVQTINRGAELFLGRTRQETFGLPVLEAFPSISGELPNLRRVIETGEVRRFERNSVLHPDRRVSVTMLPLPLPTGGAVILFDNITEQTRMQSALGEQESAIAGLIDALDDRIVFSTDQQALIDRWGRGAQAQLGWSESDLRAVPLSTLVVRCDGDGDGGAALTLRRKDGTELATRATIKPLSADTEAALYIASAAASD